MFISKRDYLSVSFNRNAIGVVELGQRVKAARSFLASFLFSVRSDPANLTNALLNLLDTNDEPLISN